MGAQVLVFTGRASEASPLLFTSATTATSATATVAASASTFAARLVLARLVTVLLVPLDAATTTSSTAFTASIVPIVLALLTSHLHIESQVIILFLHVVLDVLLLIQDLLLLFALAGRLILGQFTFDLFNLFCELSGNLGWAYTNRSAFLNQRNVMVERLLVLLVFVFDVCLLDHLLAPALLLLALLADADHLILLTLFLGQAYFDFLERFQLLLLLTDGFLGLLFLQFASDDVRVTDEA